MDVDRDGLGERRLVDSLGKMDDGGVFAVVEVELKGRVTKEAAVAGHGGLGEERGFSLLLVPHAGSGELDIAVERRGAEADLAGILWSVLELPSPNQLHRTVPLDSVRR